MFRVLRPLINNALIISISDEKDTRECTILCMTKKFFICIYFESVLNSFVFMCLCVLKCLLVVPAMFVDVCFSAKIFQNQKCSVCSHALDLPSVHFLCQHSFHQQ